MELTGYNKTNKYLRHCKLRDWEPSVCSFNMKHDIRSGSSLPPCLARQPSMVGSFINWAGRSDVCV